MPRRRVLKGGLKRRSIDTSDDEDYIMQPNKNNDEILYDDTPTIDTLNDPEFFESVFTPQNSTKTAKQQRPSPVTQQFLDNFMLQFTSEELAAKRTVETIYKASNSFSYTFQSLEEAFLLNGASFDVFKPFMKAIVSVADERFLVECSKIPYQSSIATNDAVDISILDNYEMILTNRFRLVAEKLRFDRSATGWNKFIGSVKCMFQGGLARELRGMFENVTGDDIEHKLSDTRSAIVKLSSMLKNKKARSQKRAKLLPAAFRLNDCLECIDETIGLLSLLRTVYSIVNRNIMNCQESEGLENLISTIETSLELDGGNLDTLEKIEIIKILLGEEACSCLAAATVPGGIEAALLDHTFAKNKFNDMLAAYEEAIRKQQEQGAESLRKTKSKRDAVTYILDRIMEAESPNAPTCHKHPFYIIGIPPKFCTTDFLRRCGRRLKTLLHPDTEHDPEWKMRAERAFKEASLALDKASTEVESGIITRLYRMGPAPPFAAFVGLPEAAHNEKQSSARDLNTQPGTIVPTFMIQPIFQLRCDDAKTGAITVLIDASELFVCNNGTGYMGKTKMANVYLHRPVHGNEPITITVESHCIYSMQKIALPETNRQRVIHVKFDAVQPIVFGSAWKYFVGVQICGDLGASLVTWKGLYIELTEKNRTINQLVKLLTTFEGAPFIDQQMLKVKIEQAKASPNTRRDVEVFLLECSRLAQRWADDN